MSTNEDARAAAIVDLYEIVAERTGTSLLFFANKGISLTFYVMHCSSFSQALHAVLVLQMIPWAVFSALRAYVLSRSKLLGCLVFSLSAAPAAANLVPYGYGLSGVILAKYGIGCISTDNTSADITLRAPLMTADILLICITWTKLSSRDILRGFRHSKRPTLSDLILRDDVDVRAGTVYFILPSFDVVASYYSAGDNQWYWSVTAILVSRFLLELQEANQTVVRLDPDDPLYSSRSPYYDSDTPSFISSLGGFINPDLPRSDGYYAVVFRLTHIRLWDLAKGSGFAAVDCASRMQDRHRTRTSSECMAHLGNRHT
ncbi:hypothetical protein C8T65DRAFT_697996 [Cerioporus squamosus]|nr:hypothetical protein C8T65DRAFT_697996 [Cerioporus squamosus]